MTADDADDGGPNAIAVTVQRSAANGNPIPSEFMKEYDRTGGRMIVAFDELANVRDPELLKNLYNLFRDPVNTTFADGKPRPMGGVTIVITGNAGQELFTQVPTNIPMEAQMRAWHEIYKKASNDPAMLLALLSQYYPEPLLARIGQNNMFLVPPHSYQSLRQLAQLKLHSGIFDGAIERKTKLAERFEPSALERVAGAVEVGEYVEKILPYEVRQHKAVVQRSAPARELAMLRLSPEPGDQRAQQELLRQ